MARKRLLAVWAHPDDEAFGPVGTMRMAHELGWETAVVTATRGDAGQSDRVHLSAGQTLGDVREAELRNACDVLGVEQVHVWRYADGGLAFVDQGELVGRIAHVMQRWQPTVVITFGPDGVTGHPDHVAISSATVAAFDQLVAADERPVVRRLYFHTIKPGFKVEHRMGDAPAPKLPSAVLDVSRYAAIKRAALNCHASQKDDWEPLLENQDWLTVDRFFQARPPLADGIPQSPDTTILHD